MICVILIVLFNWFSLIGRYHISFLFLVTLGLVILYKTGFAFHRFQTSMAVLKRIVFISTVAYLGPSLTLDCLFLGCNWSFLLLKLSRNLGFSHFLLLIVVVALN